MRRREFITLLGGAAAAWPLAARAQQGERMRRIGVLMNMAADDPEGQARIAAFLQGLQQSGLDRSAATCGSTYRWGTGDTEHIRKRCGGIGCARAGRHPGLWQPALAPLLQVTRTVPIVFASRRRSGRRWLRRKPGAARRQRHRIYSCSNTA